MPRYARTAYPETRSVLAAQYRELPDSQIESLLEQSLGVQSAEDFENFMRSLGNFGRSVGRVAQQALPVAGSVVGGMFGGPVGAALGGQLGALGGQAIGAATAPRPQHARPARGPVMGRAGAPAAMGSPAAAQLMQILGRPEVLRGLMSMVLGPAGASNMKVGNTSVPAAAFANLIGTLAQQALSEYNAQVGAEDVESYPEYLMDAEGQFRVDPAVPEARAGVLLEMLRETAPSPVRYRVAAEYAEDYETDEGLDEIYDAVELTEMRMEAALRD